MPEHALLRLYLYLYPSICVLCVFAAVWYMCTKIKNNGGDVFKICTAPATPPSPIQSDFFSNFQREWGAIHVHMPRKEAFVVDRRSLINRSIDRSYWIVSYRHVIQANSNQWKSTSEQRSQRWASKAQIQIQITTTERYSNLSTDTRPIDISAYICMCLAALNAYQNICSSTG